MTVLCTFRLFPPAWGALILESVLRDPEARVLVGMSRPWPLRAWRRVSSWRSSKACRSELAFAMIASHLSFHSGEPGEALAKSRSWEAAGARGSILEGPSGEDRVGSGCSSGRGGGGGIPPGMESLFWMTLLTSAPSGAI